MKSTGNHVMYRVTPVYDGDNLLANGVRMEALSVEDGGEGVSFNVFVFNSQPGVEINYADGTSRLVGADEGQEGESPTAPVYVINKNTKKFHNESCPSADDIKGKNKEIFRGSREILIERGYTACSRCKP